MIEPTDLPSTEQPIPPRFGRNGGLVRAAAILAIGNVSSRVLGLAREVVKSNLFGTSDLLGAYTVAALVPMTLFNLITGGEMVSSSLVPVFSDYARKERRGELWGVVSTFLSLATIVLLLITITVELFTPQVAWLAGARNFEDRDLIPLTIQLMRLATPAVLFLSIASILTGVLFALQRFRLPAFTGAIFNGTVVLVALLRPDKISSLVWGLLLGSLLQIALQLPALRDGRIRWYFDWRHPAVRRIVVLYSPIVAGLVIHQVAIWISYNLAITTGDNSVTYMTYATALYQFPLGLVVTALSLATLPTLSRMATAYRESTEAKLDDAAERLQEYKETLAGGLRLIVTLVLPATAGLFALAGPIIALLLEHGAFTPEDTATTARVLRFYLFGLPFAAIDQMLVFASYARKDTWRPALVGVISIVIYTIVAAALLPSLGLISLMIADSVKHVVHATIMLWLSRRHIGSSGRRSVPVLLRSLLAAVVTGAVAYLVASALDPSLRAQGFLGRLVVVGASGLSGLVIYVAAVTILDIKEARTLVQLVQRHTSGRGAGTP